jgi:hypothetical protein
MKPHPNAERLASGASAGPSRASPYNLRARGPARRPAPASDSSESSGSSGDEAVTPPAGKPRCWAVPRCGLHPDRPPAWLADKGHPRPLAERLAGHELRAPHAQVSPRPTSRQAHATWNHRLRPSHPTATKPTCHDTPALNRCTALRSDSTAAATSVRCCALSSAWPARLAGSTARRTWRT